MESRARGRNIRFLILVSVVMNGAKIKPYMCSPDGYVVFEVVVAVPKVLVLHFRPGRNSRQSKRKSAQAQEICHL